MKGDYLSVMSFTPLKKTNKHIFNQGKSCGLSITSYSALKQQMTGGMKLFCSDKSLLA